VDCDGWSVNDLDQRRGYNDDAIGEYVDHREDGVKKVKFKSWCIVSILAYRKKKDFPE